MTITAFVVFKINFIIANIVAKTQKIHEISIIVNGSSKTVNNLQIFKQCKLRLINSTNHMHVNMQDGVRLRQH